MKRILFIANYSPNSGGISTQVDVLNHCLVQDGYETDVFSTKGSVGYRIKAFFNLLKTGRYYDVFHIHACSELGFLPAIIGIKVGKRLGKRIVLTYHGGSADTFFKKHSRLVKKYLKQTDTNIVLSGYLKNVFDHYGISCVVIPNVIELRKGVYRQRDVVTPTFISIRSFTPTYNILCTLKAFQKVKQVYPEAILTLLGDGPLRLEMESFVKEQKIEGVEFVGRIPNDKVYEYLDRADIMLSSPIIDNMPMSLLEGFNAGLLVISSNVGGVPYMVEHGITGLLFESDNDFEMAEQMIWALTNQETSLQIIRNAKKEVNKFTWEKIREKVLAIYGYNQ